MKSRLALLVAALLALQACVSPAEPAAPSARGAAADGLATESLAAAGAGAPNCPTASETDWSEPAPM